MDRSKLLLDYYQAPGDTLVSTAAVESLFMQYPLRYALRVQGTAAAAIFENNPHIRGFDGNPDCVIRMENPTIHQSNQRPVHFMQSFCDLFSSQLGVKVDLLVNKPALYLSSEEKAWMNQVEQEAGYKGKFWLVCSGIKRDFTVKGWGQVHYQQVVDALKGSITLVQVGESHHAHPALKGAINLVGKTDTRQLIRLAWNAQGGIGGVSLLHHIFGALGKPFVTLGSGMEPPSWERYNSGLYLCKAACLPCFKGGCWKSRVRPLGDNDPKDNSLCEMPTPVEGGSVPRCLALVRPDEVVAAVEAYYKGGLLTY